jgi:hypothetical protein
MNNFTNFLNHLNSFSNKQSIQEDGVCMHPSCFRKMRNKQNWMNYSDTDSSMTRIGKDIIGNDTPIKVGALAGAALGGLAGPEGILPGAGVGALGGVAYNAIPHMINKFEGDNPEYDTDFDRVQKRTEQEEQKNREAVSKANPDLAARMQEDPRNRPGIGKGIARAMNDMSRMQTKVNAANINENTYRSIFLNHLNSFSNNIQEQRKLTRYEQGAIQRAKAKKQQAMAELDKTLDALPTRMPQKLRVISPGTEIGPSSRLLRAGESATETPPTQPAPAPTQYPQSTFANAEASRQTYPSLGTNPRDINGDFMVTPGEMRYRSWIRQGV